MSKLQKLFINPRMIILLVFLIISILLIHPNPYNSGATIRSIDKNSPAALAGIESPDPSISLMSREKIISVDIIPLKETKSSKNITNSVNVGSNPLKFNSQSNLFKKKATLTGKSITSVDDYYTSTSNIPSKSQVIIFTNKAKYELTINSESNKSKNFATEDLGITVYDAPTNNLRKGLDLQGGTRVLLEPERKLTNEETDLVIDVLKQRLNVFGLSDIIVREAKDLSGDQFILVEIAGANEKEVQELIAKQGKFEAKIGNETVFTGGNDITYVCRSSQCSGVNPRRGCSQVGEDWVCPFFFSIALNQKAAQRQADVTKDLDIITENNTYKYLSEKLELYLDDELIDDLNIAASLQGRAVTDIQITGSGNGTSRQAAMDNALENMKALQTVLQTGSLPVKMEIVKIDSLSPLMGEQFSKNALKVGLLALLTVASIVFIRYRKLQVAIPMVLSMLCEVIIILGVAALIKWNLDLVAIAGIIVAVGTGVDDLIVLSDETLSKDNELLSWENKRKNAFFIIMAAYFTTVVAMLPLMFAGAGLLKGFAFTTIVGISFGVFIARPAYAAIIKHLLD